ncbi:hypothetical protein FY046_01760 [Erwinia sp. 1181_3]|uniref:hypothetical protein n=1 Tax=Erwinia sp. 1181_3 TaxID=2605957 RepID=UPI004057FA53
MELTQQVTATYTHDYELTLSNDNYDAIVTCEELEIKIILDGLGFMGSMGNEEWEGRYQWLVHANLIEQMEDIAQQYWNELNPNL